MYEMYYLQMAYAQIYIGNLCKTLTDKNIIILTNKHLALILFVELYVLCNATERK